MGRPQSPKQIKFGCQSNHDIYWTTPQRKYDLNWNISKKINIFELLFAIHVSIFTKFTIKFIF